VQGNREGTDDHKVGRRYEHHDHANLYRCKMTRCVSRSTIVAQMSPSLPTADFMSSGSVSDVLVQVACLFALKIEPIEVATHAEVLPAVVAGSGLEIGVGGTTL
jgi:hypothetical protein